MPINPAEAASRYRGRLAVPTWAPIARAVAAYLLVLVGSSVLPHRRAADPAAVVGPYAWSAVQATMIYLVLCPHHAPAAPALVSAVPGR